jgi:hypothetical protein
MYLFSLLKSCISNRPAHILYWYIFVNLDPKARSCLQEHHGQLREVHQLRLVLPDRWARLQRGLPRQADGPLLSWEPGLWHLERDLRHLTFTGLCGLGYGSMLYIRGKVSLKTFLVQLLFLINFLNMYIYVQWYPGTGLPDFFWYKIPKREKINQITTNYTKCPKNITKHLKMDQMTINYTNIFHSKTLKNLPKFGFLV